MGLAVFSSLWVTIARCSVLLKGCNSESLNWHKLNWHFNFIHLWWQSHPLCMLCPWIRHSFYSGGSFDICWGIITLNYITEASWKRSQDVNILPMQRRRHLSETYRLWTVRRRSRFWMLQIYILLDLLRSNLSSVLRIQRHSRELYYCSATHCYSWHKHQQWEVEWWWNPKSRQQDFDHF